MKKISIILILGLVFLASTTQKVFAVSIEINESNQSTIFPPIGTVPGYATVTLTEFTCPGLEGYTGVQFSVNVNSSIPGTTGRVKEFYFNYGGTCSLTITASGWTISTGVSVPPTGQPLAGNFGTFSYGLTNANNTANPMTFTICCSTGNLSVWDFIVKNNKGYAFATKISQFTRTGGITTAYFATDDIPDPPTTTTTSIIPDSTTTTTSVLSTTTTTQIITTTTSTNPPTTIPPTTIPPTTIPPTTIPPTTIPPTTIPPTTIPPTTTTTGPPELIELSSFKAIPGNREVALVWVTESEIDNAGFNVYRAEAEDGEYIKINNALIPAEGNSGGATYQFVDKGLWNRETYYYKLEDIDLWDTSTLHGPEKATPRFMYGILDKILDKMIKW